MHNMTLAPSFYVRNVDLCLCPFQLVITALILLNVFVLVDEQSAYCLFQNSTSISLLGGRLLKT